MHKITRKILLMFIAILLLSAYACSNNSSSNGAKELPVEILELRQCDYRGGVKRALSLKSDVIELLENMKANNITIRQTSPNSFWSAEGYQDFVSTFMEQMIIEDTIWLNEEQTTWETILSQYQQTSRFADGNGGIKIDIQKLEKDDYLMQEVPVTKAVTGKATIEDDVIDYTVVINNLAEYRVLYDCDKDWCKAYGVTKLDSVRDKKTYASSTVELFE